MFGDNFYNWGIFIYLLMCIVLVITIMFLLKRIQNLTHQLSTIHPKTDSNTSDQDDLTKNPLGNLFSANSKSVMIGIKKDGKIITVSDSLLDLLGYTKKQLVGKNIYGTLMPIPSKKEPLETNMINRIFSCPQLYTEYETELATKNKEKIWISWTSRIVTDKSGKPTELRSVGFDITKRKKLEEELQFIASKDPQTGVLNKLSLIEVGTRELKRAIRYKHDFSVLALRLLSANRNLSSLQIENLLKQVVSLCKKTIRDVDYLGRIGEAEFILLLPETIEENVPFLEKRLEEKISDYNKNNPKLPIQVSFGVSTYTPKTKSIDELISKAISNITKRKKK